MVYEKNSRMIQTINNKLDTQKELEQAYNLLSPYSDKSRWEFENHLAHLKILTKYLSTGHTIFDAGCGIGILALTLKLMGYRVEGGDRYLFEKNNTYSVDDISGLKKIWKQNGLEIRDVDIFNLDKKYDFVISIATIEHQSRPGLFLKKLKEISNDYIYIATPNTANLLNRIRFLFGRPPLNNIEEFYMEDNFVGHWREYTLKELKQMFEWEDIKIIKAETQQSIKPKFVFKNFRDIYVNLFRLLTYILPGSGDANIILGKI